MARACGLTVYYNEKPCPRGSVSPRWVSNTGCTCQPCKDARSALTRARYARKSEQIRESRKQYYRAHASRECEKGRSLRRSDSVLRARGVEYCRAWRERNPGRINELTRLRVEADREGHRASRRLLHSLKPQIAKAKARSREISKTDRTPGWYGALDRFVLQECYHLASLRSEATGVPWEVDHLIPLRGKLASGLHCASNLQVIPATLNREKGCRMVMTEPFEWLSY